MPDVFTKAERSRLMSRIRGRGNKGTELALAKLLRDHGITGWRRHQPVLGRPDFVFHGVKLAVFVDGCFWHKCPKHGASPKTNARFWSRKLDGNVARDRRVNWELRKGGWRVVRIWEHDLPKRGDYWARRIKRILQEKGGSLVRPGSRVEA